MLADWEAKPASAGMEARAEGAGRRRQSRGTFAEAAEKRPDDDAQGVHVP